MTRDLERALRGAFALDPVAPPGAGFEARMARGARDRVLGGRPLLMAALVAGAAAATLAIARGRGEDRAATPVVVAASPAPARPAGGQHAVAEVWELVIRLSRSWSWSLREEPAPVDDEKTPPSRPARERRRDNRSAAAAVDGGDDPLCPLVAPTAARLMVVVRGGPSRISVDGQDIGPAPRLLELIPGRHRVTVRADDGRRRAYTVDLEPGEKRNLLVTLPERR